jgi:hypothetical protein
MLSLFLYKPKDIVQQQRLLVLGALGLATASITILTLLYLPPDPRFYSWIRGLTFFLWADLLILLPIATAILISAIAALIHTNSVQVPGVLPKPPLSVKKLVDEGPYPAWRSRAFSGGSPQKINVPVGTDQCWASAAPCSPLVPPRREELTAEPPLVRP